MAKRSQNLDEGINMDSMMDNMTNVVGTLLLVLIIVQMGVKSTADQVEEELANVTPQQVQQAKQQLAQIKATAEKSGANQEVAAQKPSPSRTTCAPSRRRWSKRESRSATSRSCRRTCSTSAQWRRHRKRRCQPC